MSAPAPDTVEVVVLGKGIGESVLVRLADEWVIVDSFRAAGERGNPPAPLAYLEGRGVDVASQVSCVVLSHLHADHIGGIDEVVERCLSATFSVPAAVTDGRWDELADLLAAETGSRKTKLQHVANAYRIASDDHRFQPLGATAVLNTRHRELFAIGPSSRAQVAARTAPGSRDPQAMAALRRDNFTSIVLWLEAGDAVALLGADMDCDRRVGWGALMREHGRKQWIGNAGFVKVPHHGSETAHEPAVYTQWARDPVAVVTPNRGSGLPRPDMIARLKRVSRSLWLAGPPDPVDLTEFDTEGRGKAFAVTAECARAGSGGWTVSATSAAQQL